jgi:hypothetical protein
VKIGVEQIFVSWVVKKGSQSGFSKLPSTSKDTETGKLFTVGVAKTLTLPSNFQNHCGRRMGLFPQRLVLKILGPQINTFSEHDYASLRLVSALFETGLGQARQHSS